MGCCNEIVGRQETYTDILEFFKVSIGLSKFSSLFMDRVFYKYSKNKLSTIPQFYSAAKELEIDIIQYQSFFDQFTDGFDYDTIKLSTLGVLLGSDSNLVKIKILFDNYDSDLSKVLERGEVIQMIADLIKISCIYIPKYCHETNPEREDIKEYYICLRNMSRAMINHLESGLLDEKSSIIYDEFKRSFEKGIYSNLLDDTKLRILCFKYYLGIAESTKIVLRTLKDKKLKAEVGVKAHKLRTLR